MVFPFTFNFSVPGLLNPFRAYSASADQPAAKISDHSEVFKNQFRAHQTPTSEHCHRRSQESEYRDIPAPAYPSSSSTYPSSSSYPISIPAATSGRRISRSQLPKIPRRHSPSPSPSSLRALPLSRKRGWEPAFGVESIQSLTSNGKSSSTTSLTFVSSSGYLDTPAKYREMAEDITMSDDHYRGNATQSDDDDDAPPMKKRRGLAGSIVSTAVSAALIGTAVGLTVYRLWRDRGKEGQIANAPHQQDQDSDKQIPPPPYDAGHWRAGHDEPVSAPAPVPVPPVSVPQPRAVPVAPSTPRAKGRRVGAGTGTGARKTAVGARQQHSARRTRGTPKHAGAGAGVVGSPRARPEFDFAPAQDEDRLGGQTEVEDKMDWLGDKMALLIEQGRRALQSEVVVMSEAKEDEVDDGRGGWEDHEEEEDDSDLNDDESSYRHSRAGSIRGSSSKPHRQRKSRPRDIAVPAHAPAPAPVPIPSGSTQHAKVGLGLYGVSSSQYPSGSLSSSPRRSGFAPGSAGLSSYSSSYAYATYATPSTSYTPAHASAGLVPSSSSSLPSPFTSPGRGHVRGISYESALPAFGTPNASASASVNEEHGGWESPEIREGMERARARLLARRNGMSGV